MVPLAVQDSKVSALIDTLGTRNLISQRDYEALRQASTLRPPGPMMGVAVNIQEISFLGRITVR